MVLTTWWLPLLRVGLAIVGALGQRQINRNKTRRRLRDIAGDDDELYLEFCKDEEIKPDMECDIEMGSKRLWRKINGGFNGKDVFTCYFIVLLDVLLNSSFDGTAGCATTSIQFIPLLH